MSFPEKLHRVACAQLYPDIFWSTDGKSFAIHRSGYQRHIMFVFFNQNQLTSFQSIASRYQFTTELSMDVPEGFPAIAERAQEFIFYSHPSFIQEEQDLSSTIHPRKRASKGGHVSNGMGVQARPADMRLPHYNTSENTPQRLTIRAHTNTTVNQANSTRAVSPVPIRDFTKVEITLTRSDRKQLCTILGMDVFLDHEEQATTTDDSLSVVMSLSTFECERRGL